MKNGKFIKMCALGILISIGGNKAHAFETKLASDNTAYVNEMTKKYVCQRPAKSERLYDFKLMFTTSA